MLRIGTIDWGDCEKCIHYDKEDGCQILDKIEIERGDEDVYCIDGIEAEGEGE
jgi:hypothetical protein